MAKKTRKPLSPEALRKKRSRAAKKGWETRRARQIPEKISKTWEKLGKELKRERETRKAAINSRIYGEPNKRIKQLEREARESEKQRIKLQKEIDRLKKEADKAVVKRLVEDRKITKHQAETIAFAHAREGWVDLLPEKWLYHDGGIALNPCRLRHTDQYGRYQEMFRRAEAQDGGMRFGPSVQATVKQILTEYYDLGYYEYFPDEEPLDENEVWTLYASP